MKDPLRTIFGPANPLLKAIHMDVGLLTARVGLGIMFILHGLPKVVGGVDTWKTVGGMPPFLADGTPEAVLVSLGLLAAIVEFGGGLLLLVGFWARTAAFLLFGVMVVAFTTKLDGDLTLMTFAMNAGWPLELAFVFLALAFTGPGRFSIDKA